MKLLVFTFVWLMTLSHCRAGLRLTDVNMSEFQTQFSSKLSILKKVSKIASKHTCGEIAAEGSAPWQVSIQNQLGNHICGGVIIGDNVVLTAASCVAALDKSDVRVITGTNNWINPGAIYKVADIVIHCNYDKPLYYNDVAIIKLSKLIVYDNKTQNITLANFDELEENDILTMTGWGSPLPEKLKKSSVVYIKNEDCIQTLGRYSGNVDHGHVCVLPKRFRGACHGDAGGPLVNAEGQLVGIGNWGISCGHGFPEFFARISFYSDWIRTSMKGCSLQ